MEDRHAYTLTDAARVLGTSEGALRQRIRRGTLETFKENGRVYVYLPRTDGVRDDVHTPESHALRSADDELRARVVLLEQELERAHELLQSAEERDRETRRLLAAALERIAPQLEAPSEPREAPEMAAEGEDEPRPGGQEGAQRPWWRRVFGA
jgi:AraC-like DNA-binding protein